MGIGRVTFTSGLPVLPVTAVEAASIDWTTNAPPMPERIKREKNLEQFAPANNPGADTRVDSQSLPTLALPNVRDGTSKYLFSATRKVTKRSQRVNSESTRKGPRLHSLAQHSDLKSTTPPTQSILAINQDVIGTPLQSAAVWQSRVVNQVLDQSQASQPSGDATVSQMDARDKPNAQAANQRETFMRKLARDLYRGSQVALLPSAPIPQTVDFREQGMRLDVVATA